MHWRLFLYLKLILTTLSVNAQDHTLRELLNKPVLNCDSLESLRLRQIEKLSFFEDEDSIQGIVNNLEQSCGYSESIHRLRLLYKIRKHELDPQEIHPYYREMSDIYLIKLEDLSYAPHLIEYTIRDSYLAHQQFLRWTNAVADSLLKRPDNTAEEEFFLSLYAAESFNLLKHTWFDNDRFDQVPLARAYREEIYEAETSGDYVTLEAGAWLPTGVLSHYLGTCFMAGATFRHLINDNWGIGLSLQMRFNRSQSDFVVLIPDTSVLTSSNTGFGLGFHGLYKLFPDNKLHLNLIASGGVDILNTSAVKGYSSEGYEQYVNIWTYDMAAGCELSLPVLNFDRFGLRLLHHWVNYKNDNELVSPLYGNFISLTAFYRF